MSQKSFMFKVSSNSNVGDFYKEPSSSSNNQGNFPPQKNKNLSIEKEDQIFDQNAALDFYQYLFNEYNNRNVRGNQSGESNDWSNYYGRLILKYKESIGYLQKNQKCQGLPQLILQNIKSQKLNFDDLMNVPKRNFQISESGIAKSLRKHILPYAQELVRVLGKIPNVKVKDLQQIHKPYGWVYFPGGRRQPFSLNEII